MDHDIKHRDEPETDVTEVGWQGLEMLFLRQSVGREFLRELSVELQVFLVPVLQEVVVRRHDPAELVHPAGSDHSESQDDNLTQLSPVPELVRFEQQQLDDEEADLGLVPLVVPEGHAEDEPVQGDDVVFPDHAVHGVNALVDVAAPC